MPSKRTATVARTLQVGGCLIEHVPFIIFNDEQQPFDELPQQERGGIGLPVQFALRSLRWDSTGAGTTDLWPPFAKRFAAQLATARRETRRVGGVGQTIEVESLIAPSLPVRLGGKAITLKPAEVHLAKTDGASLRDYGRAGMDLLAQSSRVTVDFRQMRLVLE